MYTVQRLIALELGGIFLLALPCDFVLHVLVLLFYVQSSIELLYAINHSLIHGALGQFIHLMNDGE